MIDVLFSQYAGYSNLHIFLEITAVIFGLLSVWYAKKDHIWVFPTGIVSTIIFTYLLWQWGLLGDMSINFYYTIMSVYGWYHWTRKKGGQELHTIANCTKKEYGWGVFIFVATVIGVIIIYTAFDRFTTTTAYVDTLTTGLFFVAMWLMAKRKIQHWILWIIADIISIPLYFIKGYTFTSIQYILFTFIAIYGYREWKRTLDSNKQAY
jgi:nicotinamide mononucleotide transporter